MLREPNAAALGSCVTMMTVLPAWRLSDCSIFSTSWAECESRLPVGSSATTSCGIGHQRAGDGDALLLAAGKLLGQMMLRSASPTISSAASTRRRRSARPRNRARDPARELAARGDGVHRPHLRAPEAAPQGAELTDGAEPGDEDARVRVDARRDDTLVGDGAERSDRRRRRIRAVGQADDVGLVHDAVRRVRAALLAEPVGRVEPGSGHADEHAIARRETLHRRARPRGSAPRASSRR